MAATLTDVARIAGVSLATASRAFGDPSRLAAETRQKVLAAATELGYETPGAAGPRSFAVLVPDVSNPVFAAFLKSIQERAWPGRHRMVLADTDESPEREREQLASLAPSVDGLILCSPRLPAEELRRLAGSTPLVVINGEPAGGACILMDADEGLRQAVDHLVALGHRRLAYVPGPASSWANAQRLAAVTRLSKERGVELTTVGNQSPTVEGGLAAAASVVASGATAAMAYNDLVAVGLLSGARAMGRRCPEDLSVVGVDDLEIAAAAEPGLTSVRVAIERSGTLGLDLLLEQLAGKSPSSEPLRLPSQLIVRGSTFTAAFPQHAAQPAASAVGGTQATPPAAQPVASAAQPSTTSASGSRTATAAPLPHLGKTHDGGASRRRPSSAGIVHLGLGNFHRAHQAVYTRAAIDAAGGGAAGAGGSEWGIVGISSRSEAVPAAMKEQDLLYTVVEISPAGESFSVPAVHTDAFAAAAHPERVVREIASAGTRIVSLTVTENGYYYSPRTGHLAADHPAIQADLASPGAPKTPIGQIVRAVQGRARSHGEPLTVLSCDNLAENGRHTERLVTEFASLLPEREAAETLAFLEQRVTFPSTMVDRIVPATTDHYRELVAARRGYRDSIPVPAEPFTMWVLEDRFAAGRPAWEAGGAVFSDEVSRYEQLKVRLLNGTHSLLAYLGALSGAELIAESVGTPAIEAAARRVLRDEYRPSVTAPAGVDLDAYEEQLFERWRNSALGHRTSQVGSDGSVKLRQRIPEPAIALLKAGTMPHFLALTAAGYLACLAPFGGFDPGPHAAAMVDPARPALAQAAAESTTALDLAQRVLRDRHLLGDAIAGRDDFIGRTAELLDVIRRHGALAAVREADRAASQ